MKMTSQSQIHYWAHMLDEAFSAQQLQYDPPYSLEQIKASYPEDVYLSLAADPVHRWRAESGIELVHKEPDEAELDRIWANWQLMDSKQKSLSDQKSIELFGVDNAAHYAALKLFSKALKHAVETYKMMLDIDLSYMDFKTSKQPVYNNGEPCFEYKPEECAGDWTKLGWIRLNPNLASVKAHYDVAMDDETFVTAIVAHELAHEIWNKHADAQLKADIASKAKSENFTTPYLVTVKPSKLEEETFCEYLSSLVLEFR